MNENLLISDSRPTRADAVKNRALLLETAQKLFHEQGVEVVSMTVIAQEAGVGKGTLYRHFESKAELCQALLDEDQRALQARTLERISGPHNPRETLRWFLHEVVNFVDKNNDLLCAGAGSPPSLDHPAHIWWWQTIRGLLARIDPSRDVDYLADTLYVMIDVRTFRFQHHVLGYAVRRILDGIDELLARLID